MSKPIHHEIIFNTDPERIFEAITDTKKFSELTGAPAEIDPISGGKFTCFDGMITGQTIENLPNSMAVQEPPCRFVHPQGSLDVLCLVWTCITSHYGY